MGERVDFEIEWWVRAFQERTSFFGVRCWSWKNFWKNDAGSTKILTQKWLLVYMSNDLKVWIFSVFRFAKMRQQKSTHRVTQWYFWILFINHHNHYDSSQNSVLTGDVLSPPLAPQDSKSSGFPSQQPSQQVQHHSHECGAWVPWGFDVGAGVVWSSGGSSGPGDHELYIFW